MASKHENSDDDQSEHGTLAFDQPPPGAGARTFFAEIDGEGFGDGHR